MFKSLKIYARYCFIATFLCACLYFLKNLHENNNNLTMNKPDALINKYHGGNNINSANNTLGLSTVTSAPNNRGRVTDCLTRVILRQVPGGFETQNYLQLRPELRSESQASRSSSFGKIFKNKEWGTGKDKGYEDIQASGPGSALKATRQIVAILDSVIAMVKSRLQKDVIRMLDIPCGDMVWMNEFLKTRKDVEYVGMDIVPALIETHRKRYANHTNWSFTQHDVAKENITGSYDFIFSRQMTQHLMTADTIQTLNHLSHVGSFLLITDYPEMARNFELDPRQRYRFRKQNLALEPYKMAPPICMTKEPGSWLSLYRLPLKQITKCKQTTVLSRGNKFVVCS